MPRLQLMEWTAPAAVGLVSGGVSVGVAAAEKDLAAKKVAGTVSQDTKLSPIVEALPPIVDYGALLLPIGYATDIIPAGYGGPALAGAGLAIGVRRGAIDLGRAVFKLTPNAQGAPRRLRVEGYEAGRTGTAQPAGVGGPQLSGFESF